MPLEEQVQDQVAFKILSNIATNGLLSSDKLVQEEHAYLGSGDLNPQFNPDVNTRSIVYINEMQSECFLYLEHLMNEESAGAWTITLERAYKLNFGTDTKALRTEFEERLKHSVLLILKPQLARIRRNIYPDPDSREHSTFAELRLEKGLAPDQILQILTPEHLYNKVKQCFPAVSVTTVGFKTERIGLPIFEIMKYWPKRYGKEITLPLQVPDFDSALSEIVTKTQPKSISCHAVRLPTLKDTQYNLEQRVPFYLKAQYEIQNRPTDTKTTHERQQQSAILIQKHIRRHQAKTCFQAYSTLHKKTFENLKEHKLDLCEENLRELSRLKTRLYRFGRK